MSQHFDIAIVGGGIVGLAHAYAAHRRGKRVVIFERDHRAIGATIRNFGLVWPIGQRAETFDRAMVSRSIWLELAAKARFWCVENGCLHLAHKPEEMRILEEFKDTSKDVGYQIKMLDKESVLAKSHAVTSTNLLGGLYSSTELNVDPRQAMIQLTAYFKEELGIRFHHQTSITRIDNNRLYSGNRSWSADHIFVCSGADLETLYPEILQDSGIVKCKLQMLRTGSQPQQWQLGPSLCAGLTLLHYASFEHCSGLDELAAVYDAWNENYRKYGIHVLLSQTALGELTIGDSHEYGDNIEPFDTGEINDLILAYLHQFATFPDTEIRETWHGIYAKLPGKTEFIAKASENVTLVNAMSGAGMTLSFGLAEEHIDKMYGNAML